jgi:splicing factor 45
VPAQKKAAGSIPFKPIGMSIAAAGPKADDPVSTTTTVAKPTVKTTLEDWVGDDDDVNGFYTGNQKERQQRGGRKKRKKNRVTPPPPTNWDDIYDPLRPNSYEEYKEGDEKIREMEDWRERLYGNKRGVYDDSSDEDDRRSAAGSIPFCVVWVSLLPVTNQLYRQICASIELFICASTIWIGQPYK